MNQIIHLDLGGVNVYLLKAKDSFVLIDTGGYTFRDRPLNDRCGLLDEKLIENGCTPEKLKLIILTHGDIDHIANCKFLKEKYNTKIFIHKDDLHLTKDLTIEKIFSNFKFNSVGYKIISGIMHPLFVKITKKIISNYNEFEVDTIIDENFNLKPYDLNAEILHLPGHTKGSIGLLFDDGSLIVGDTLSNTKKPDYAMNALDFKLLRKSVSELKNKNITMVYPGHGDPFNFSEFKY